MTKEYSRRLRLFCQKKHPDTKPEEVLGNFENRMEYRAWIKQHLEGYCSRYEEEHNLRKNTIDRASNATAPEWDLTFDDYLEKYT